MAPDGRGRKTGKPGKRARESSGGRIMPGHHVADASDAAVPRPVVTDTMACGKAKSCSVFDAFDMAAERSGRQMGSIPLAVTLDQIVESWERWQKSQFAGSGSGES